MLGMVKQRRNASSEPRLVLAMRRAVDKVRLELWKVVLTIVRPLSFIWL